MSSNKLEYNRRCNEAPIGLISKKKDSAVISLGYSVANFPNLNCLKKSVLLETYTRFHRYIYQIDLAINPLKNRNLSDKWIISDVEEYDFRSQLSVRYSSACEREKMSFFRIEKSQIKLGHLSSVTDCRRKAKSYQQHSPFQKK